MSNAVFITLLALFFQVWGAAIIGAELAKWRAGQSSFPSLLRMIGAAFPVLIPLIVIVPAWLYLNQPLMLGLEALVLLLAIGIPILMPLSYREALFGSRMYPAWLGLALVVAGLYIVQQKWEVAFVMGSCALSAGGVLVWWAASLWRKYHSFPYQDTISNPFKNQGHNHTRSVR